jgi:hypothetical protein
MNKFKIIIISQVLFLLLFSGCDSNSVSTIPQVEKGNFILYVSNQSPAIDPVDIKVLIDGKTAVSQEFLNKGGNNWIKFEFQLKNGNHRLSSNSSKRLISKDTLFTLPATPCSVIDFWYSPPSSGSIEIREFSIIFLESPPLFM